MKMTISRDLLRQKIVGDPDLPIEAGYPAAALEGLDMLLSPGDIAANDDGDLLRLNHVFGVLVKQLRRRESMSCEELSEKARIEEDELQQIEHDPHYRPRPRTVHQLANVFNLPERAFMKLSGATITHDTEFREEAYRFAAKSENMAQLSAEEREALNDYIGFLAKDNGS